MSERRDEMGDRLLAHLQRLWQDPEWDAVQGYQDPGRAERRAEENRRDREST